MGGNYNVTLYNRRVHTEDVVIAGAGIIGLSLALELRDAGFGVSVVERGRAMSEASWAAAGMLAAGDPDNPPALRELSLLSMRLYPQYLQRIAGLSGCRIPFRTSIALQGIRPGHSLGMGAHGSSLSPATVQNFVPGLIGKGRDFLQLDEPSLDPRDLCAGLPLAAKAAGVTLLEESPILGVRSSRNAAIEIETSRGCLSAGTFINCCGAWSGQIVGRESSETELQIAPRKGQILEVRLGPGASLGCVVRTPEIYLVPRGDGRVVIGATTEDAGFDKHVDDVAIQSLLARAVALWPPIASAEIVESWAGLRSSTPDGLPVMGPLGTGTGEPRHFVATGHFRNGILLAPATARIVSQMVRRQKPEIDITPFCSGRAIRTRSTSDNAPACAL